MSNNKQKTFVRYEVEVKDLYGSNWQSIGSSADISLALKDLEKEKQLLPKMNWRLVRIEWYVVV